MHRLITKADRAAARHIPPNSLPVPHPRGPDVAIVYTSDTDRNGRMHYSACAYRGTAARPAWNYVYSKPESRAEKIKEFFAGIEAHAKFRAERQAERQAETSPFAAPPSAEVIALSTAATAKEVRATLTQAFPHTKFSVRSSVYSMGSSIDVQWTDGPTHAQVSPILHSFDASGFDASQDMKTYLGPSLWRGHRVRWGADSVHGSRAVSLDTMKRAALETAFACDLPLLEIVAEPDGSNPHTRDGGQAVPYCTYKKENGEIGFAHDSHRNEQYSQLVYQYARTISLEDAQPHELPQREPKPTPAPAPYVSPVPKPDAPPPGSEEYKAIARRVEALMQHDPASRLVN